MFNEAVRTIKNPNIKPRTGPDTQARAFDRPGTNRSELKKLDRANYYSAIEFSDEGDYIMVLVLGSNGNASKDYHGVNVVFYPNGKIEGQTNDKLAASQWKNDKAEITKIAKASLKDETLSGAYDGLQGKPSKRGKGKLSFDIKESKITFKEFLTLNEIKMRDSGWYVCDHMDTPIEGPMQEGAAKDRADELSAKHAKAHGKGDVSAFYAEHFSETEIRRMNESQSSGPIDALNDQSRGVLLSDAHEKLLLADFKEWSGGFTPDDLPWDSEGDDTSVQHYIDTAIPTGLSKKAVIAHLKYIAANGAKNAP